jgi:hypothetical protein
MILFCQRQTFLFGTFLIKLGAIDLLAHQADKQWKQMVWSHPTTHATSITGKWHAGSILEQLPSHKMIHQSSPIGAKYLL